MKQHILVVDDEMSICELLQTYLTKHGYDVSTTGTSAGAFAALDRWAVDLVVLDIGLADEDGLRLLPNLKSKHPGTRVVMLTGMGFVEDLLEEAQQNGADGYVSKMLPLDELTLAIQKTLRPASQAAPLQP